MACTGCKGRDGSIDISKVRLLGAYFTQITIAAQRIDFSLSGACGLAICRQLSVISICKTSSDCVGSGLSMSKVDRGTILVVGGGVLCKNTVIRVVPA